MDNDCRYVEPRFQLVMETRMLDAIKTRADADNVHAADVVRSAIAEYLGWPPYVYPRAARWSKETRGPGQRAGQR